MVEGWGVAQTQTFTSSCGCHDSRSRSRLGSLWDCWAGDQMSSGTPGRSAPCRASGSSLAELDPQCHLPPCSCHPSISFHCSPFLLSFSTNITMLPPSLGPLSEGWDPNFPATFRGPKD